MNYFVRSLSLLLVLSLTACAPEVTAPSTPVQGTIQARLGGAMQVEQPVNTPDVPPTQLSAADIREIIASKDLILQINEEMMIIGQVRLQSGKILTFDDIENFLQIENQNPELLELDFKNRLVRALQSGEALINLSIKEQPAIKFTMRFNISTPAPEIDPNIALVEVAIR